LIRKDAAASFFVQGDFMNRSFWIGCVALVGFTLAMPTTLHAGTKYDLTIDNMSSVSGTFGSAVVTLGGGGTYADVVFTAGSLSSGQKILFGSQGAVAVNTSTPLSSVSVIASSTVGGRNTLLTPAGSGNEDGFGSFSHTIDSFDGDQYAQQSITIRLTRASGTWANDASVLTPTSNGHYLAAHVFVYNNANYTGGAALTGYATSDEGNNTITETPEPATMSLAGIGFAGIAGYVWRKRRQKAAA
jgi:LPXTG-motif cell wall-anchored protein